MVLKEKYEPVCQATSWSYVQTWKCILYLNPALPDSFRKIFKHLVTIWIFYLLIKSTWRVSKKYCLFGLVVNNTGYLTFTVIHLLTTPNRRTTKYWWLYFIVTFSCRHTKILSKCTSKTQVLWLLKQILESFIKPQEPPRDEKKII